MVHILRKTINVPPPSDYTHFSPSELFRYFFQVGHWTEDSFSDEFQNFTRGNLVSTVTINKWKNKDVIPKRYAGPLFKLIESMAEPENASKWVDAFETVWARYSAGRSKNKVRDRAPVSSEHIKAQHQRWISRLYTENRDGYPFSPADIYVPLQLSDSSQKILAPQDVADVIEHINETETTASHIDWILISGGPGSGKSMTALHMANQICGTNAFPIYIRGSRLSNVDIDVTDLEQSIEDVFSIKSFLQHFRASSSSTAILILDGLDEINGSRRGTPDKLNQLISDLKIEQAVCTNHNKKLKIIAFGRDAHIQFAQRQLNPDLSVHLELLSLDGSYHNNHMPLDVIPGEDLREIWWIKYLEATNNIADPTLPDFLTTEFDDFSQFGSDPLLSYLICHIALGDLTENRPKQLPHERVNELTYASNKNEIYQTIFERVALDVKPSLDPNRFLSVLQHIALAIWHIGDQRNVSLKSVYDSVQNPETKASFQALRFSGLSAQTSPSALITAFYYRLSKHDTASTESMIEFTHKSFSEYLTSTLIFDRFAQLISAIEQENEIETAIKNWVHLSRAGHHSPSLANFCQKEAAIRYETLANFDWDLALPIIQFHIHGHYFSDAGLCNLEDMRHSNSLLFFVWSCLNLERQKRTDTYFSLANTSQTFSVSDLKSLQPPNRFEFNSGSLVEPTLRGLTFLTPALSALKLKSADMSQLSFGLGHIQNLICERVSFAMTYWNHVKMTVSHFNQAVFQQAIFHQWRLADCHFSSCFFQGSRFEGAIFKNCHFTETFFSQCHFSDVEFIASTFDNVIFDRCVFTQSNFVDQINLEAPANVKFRHCTFLDMQKGLTGIPLDCFENTLPQTGNENNPYPPKNSRIQTGLETLI